MVSTVVMALFLTAPVPGIFRKEARFPHTWRKGENNDNLVRHLLKPNHMPVPTVWRVHLKFNVPVGQRDKKMKYPENQLNDPYEPGYWTSFVTFLSTSRATKKGDSQTISRTTP